MEPVIPHFTACPSSLAQSPRFQSTTQFQPVCPIRSKAPLRTSSPVRDSNFELRPQLDCAKDTLSYLKPVQDHSQDQQSDTSISSQSSQSSHSIYSFEENDGASGKDSEDYSSPMKEERTQKYSEL